MDPLTWMLIGSAAGAGIGALGYGQKKDNAEEQRRINAAAMYYSPWTGMRPDSLYTPEPSLLGEMASGALLGASFGGMLGKGGKTDTKTPQATTGTDNSSVAGGGTATPSAQMQVPTDNKSLYDRHKSYNMMNYPQTPASAYAGYGQQPFGNPWMGMMQPSVYGPNRNVISSPNAVFLR